MGKTCSPLGKIEFWTHWEFCAYHRIFGIRKGHEYYYQLFDVLPKQATCEMKALQLYKFTTMISWCWRFHVLSCWRFFPCQLSHRYVMKMYCPSITILGYTSQSRKFEKFISIHLNKKPPIFRSSHQRCSIKAVLKNFTIFTTRKHLGWSIFLIKLQTSRPATLLKRDSNTGVFLWILQNL